MDGRCWTDILQDVVDGGILFFEGGREQLGKLACRRWSDGAIE